MGKELLDQVLGPLVVTEVQEEMCQSPSEHRMTWLRPDKGRRLPRIRARIVPCSSIMLPSRLYRFSFLLFHPFAVAFPFGEILKLATMAPDIARLGGDIV